jgi:hypothetical protein
MGMLRETYVLRLASNRLVELDDGFMASVGSVPSFKMGAVWSDVEEIHLVFLRKSSRGFMILA